MIKRLFIGIVLLLSVFPSVVYAQQKVAEASVDLLLEPLLSDSFSFIKKDIRREIHAQFLRIEKHHSSYLGEDVISDDSRKVKIEKESINYLSTSLPEPEKIIIFFLKSHKSALSLYIEEQRALSGQLQGTKRRLRRKDERIFKHYGDRYYSELISIVHEISRMQNYLSAECNITAPIGSALKVKSDDVAAFVLEQFKVIKVNAETLNEHVN